MSMRRLHPFLACLFILLSLIGVLAQTEAAYPDATTTVGPATIHGCSDGDTKCDQERRLGRQANAFLIQHLDERSTLRLNW
jgi:hypothetical protein